MTRDSCQTEYLEIRISPLIGPGPVEIFQHSSDGSEHLQNSFSSLRDKGDFERFLLALGQLLGEGPKYGLIDLSKMPWVGSAGLVQFVEIHKKFQAAQGQLVFVGPNPRVSQIFRLTQLDKVFVIVETVGEALQVFEECCGGGCT